MRQALRTPQIWISVVTTTDPIARQLPRLLDTLSLLATKKNKIIEVIIVDDLKQWAEGGISISPRAGLLIRPLWYPEYRGQMLATISGIEITQGQRILTIDPDMYECISEIPEMIGLLDKGTFQAVHGKRARRPDIGRLRQLASAAINALVRHIAKIDIADIGSPVLLINREVLGQISLRENGNPLINAYVKLGPSIAVYKLHCSSQKTPSQYSIIALARLFFRMVLDSLKVRFQIQRPQK